LEFDSETTKSVIKELSDFIEKKGDNPSVSDFFDELRMFQVGKVFDHKVRLYIVLESFFGSNMDAKSLSDQKKHVEKAITNASMKTPDVLWSFNAYLEENKGASKTFPHCLKVLYDQDWCDEAEILRYYNDDANDGEPGFEKAKEVAAPFLKWLAEADDDDSDEDEDEDESD